MNDSLEKPQSSPFAPRRFGIAAQVADARKAIAEVDPLKVPNRLAIEFDDSGSMGGQKINDAKTAVRNFLASCKQLDTSVAVHPMNQDAKPLTVNYDLINLFLQSVGATGGTPLYTKLMQMLDTDLTRAIVFSDGDPTDAISGYGETAKHNDDLAVEKAKEKKIPVDTIFIGEEHETGYKVMKDLAERTGGIFIHFKDSKSLSSGLKYLTPGFRGLLADPSMKDKVQKGQV